MSHKKRRNQSKANEQGRGFVQISRVFLESEACKSLKCIGASKALTAFYLKFSAAEARGEKPICEFTYGEAEKVYGIARRTFSRGIQELLEHGFIDFEKRGGNRNKDAWDQSIFRKSERWRNFNTPKFIDRGWHDSEI
jgi:hypothetical protein